MTKIEMPDDFYDQTPDGNVLATEAVMNTIRTSDLVFDRVPPRPVGRRPLELGPHLPCRGRWMAACPGHGPGERAIGLHQDPSSEPRDAGPSRESVGPRPRPVPAPDEDGSVGLLCRQARARLSGDLHLPPGIGETPRDAQPAGVRGQGVGNDHDGPSGSRDLRQWRDPSM